MAPSMVTSLHHQTEEMARILQHETRINGYLCSIITEWLDTEEVTMGKYHTTYQSYRLSERDRMEPYLQRQDIKGMARVTGQNTNDQ